MPRRSPTLKRKFEQMRDSGAVLLIGTDSGVPLNFHSDSTWRELDTWVDYFGVPVMEAPPRGDVLARGLHRRHRRRRNGE